MTQCTIFIRWGVPAPYRYIHKLSVTWKMNCEAVCGTAQTTPGLLNVALLGILSTIRKLPRKVITQVQQHHNSCWVPKENYPKKVIANRENPRVHQNRHNLWTIGAILIPKKLWYSLFYDSMYNFHPLGRAGAIQIYSQVISDLKNEWRGCLWNSPGYTGSVKYCLTRYFQIRQPAVNHNSKSAQINHNLWPWRYKS